MTKTTALRTELTRILSTLTDNVHYGITSIDTDYPYIVYELNEIMHDYGKTTYNLELNLLDYGTLTNDIEELADNIHDVLHKYSFINPYIQFTIYRGLRTSVEEEDKKVIRRRLTFEIQMHELKEE